MELDLVIFDLDNTIWDFETNSRQALHELYADLDTTYALGHQFDHFHASYVEINYRYWDNYERGLIDKQTLRYGRFYDAFAGLDFHDRTVIDKLADRYLEISPLKTAMFEGAIEVLEQLSKKYKMAIISNGFNEVVELKVKHCGLAPYFHHVQTSEAAGIQKPNPRIFEMVLEKFEAKPARTLMIGDNLHTDIGGGKAAGLHTILFDPWNRHAGYAEHKITHLKELLNVI